MRAAFLLVPLDFTAFRSDLQVTRERCSATDLKVHDGIEKQTSSALSSKLRGGGRGVNFRLLMKYFSTVRGFVDTFPLALIGMCTRLHRLSNECHDHGAFCTSQEQVRN